MSEIDAAAAAPSTSDIATSVIESYEGSESTDVSVSESLGAESSTEASHVESPAVEVKADTPGIIKAAPTDEEKLLEEFGFKEAFKPDGREHYIPRSKVLKMIGSGLKRGSEKWTTERTTIESERDRFRGDLDEFYTDVRGEPKAFLEKLSGVDPRYRSFLEPQAAAPAAPVLEMPTPDVTLPDGATTYSVAGIQKLIEWAVDAKMLPKVDERLKPWTERDKAEQARIAGEKHQTAVRERTQGHLKEAQTWPLFGPIAADGKLSPFQQEVLNTLKADKTLDLRGAYMKVALPRLTEDDTKKRERWIQEQNANAAKTPAVPRAGGDLPRTSGQASTRDIAARVIDQLERSGS